MRKCGAPKEDVPWICPGCGNENYAARLFCNMRKCGLARPGLTEKQLRSAQTAAAPLPRPPVVINTPPRPMVQFGGGPGFSMPIQHPQQIRSPQPPMGGAPDGNWNCPYCGNVNYPSRTVCNARKCGMPRPAGGGGGVRGGGGFYGSQPPAPMGMRAAPPQSAASSHPEGSWVCSDCGNVNFPTRDSCNKRTCGKPRFQVDGGPPPSAPSTFSAPRPSLGGPAEERPPPEGSWTCPSCQNVNYPTRTHCNKRSCGLPKPS